MHFIMQLNAASNNNNNNNTSSTPSNANNNNSEPHSGEAMQVDQNVGTTIGSKPGTTQSRATVGEQNTVTASTYNTGTTQ